MMEGGTKATWFDGFPQLRVILANELDALVGNGWKLLKTVVADEVVTLQKQYPYKQDGNSYPTTFGFSDQAVVRTVRFVVGLPEEIVENMAKAEISQLNMLLSAEREKARGLEKQVVDLKTAVAHAVESRAAVIQERDEYKNSTVVQKTRIQQVEQELDQLKVGMNQLITKMGAETLKEALDRDQVQQAFDKVAQEATKK